MEPDVPDGVKPDPVQEVAALEVHVSVEDWPLMIDVGLAVRLAVGGVAAGELVEITTAS